MIGATALDVIRGDTPQYWRWTSLPESRFSEVAELQQVWWLEVKGKIEPRILSSRTRYATYLVLKLNRNKKGFRERTVALRVNVEGTESGKVRSVYLDRPENAAQQAQERGDGWMEIEMGEFWNEYGDDGTVECSLRDFDPYLYKQGLIIEGIELRPKEP
ncbi:hypothetical protein DITRI_Ditri15bG0060100 [Diplodiscus trichospermus]